jgi:hypothetical protein
MENSRYGEIHIGFLFWIVRLLFVATKNTFSVCKRGTTDVSLETGREIQAVGKTTALGDCPYGDRFAVSKKLFGVVDSHIRKISIWGLSRFFFEATPEIVFIKARFGDGCRKIILGV